MDKITSNHLADRSQQLLERHRHIADGISILLAPHVEVIIHDLTTQTIAHLANNFSQREIGDASALDDMTFGPDEQIIGPYDKLNWDGRRLRSISILLRDDNDNAIGMLCMNMDISVFENAQTALNLLMPHAAIKPQPEKLFRDDWQERINTFLHQWLREHHLELAYLTSQHKRELVHQLYAEGAFEGKSTANYVAKILNMGRATVFKYLKEAKGN
ncbi:helix-turn-helix transcriptional regulator [Iodobacter fluviatilis]|nr:PAS domain-containing protein [Iodobacter fluviatilis]